MRGTIKNFSRKVLSAFSCLIAGVSGGCSNQLGSGAAGSQTIGIVFREASAKWKVFDKKIHLPAARVQRNIAISRNLESWLRADFSLGHVKHREYLTHIRARGSFFSIGSGFSYYPFSENFSLDAGGEIFYAYVPSVKGDFFGFKRSIRDDVFGFGVSAGISTMFEINEKLFLVGSGGYSWTDDLTRELSADFDGWYVFIGIKLNME